MSSLQSTNRAVENTSSQVHNAGTFVARVSLKIIKSQDLNHFYHVGHSWCVVTKLIWWKFLYHTYWCDVRMLYSSVYYGTGVFCVYFFSSVVYQLLLSIFYSKFWCLKQVKNSGQWMHGQKGDLPIILAMNSDSKKDHNFAKNKMVKEDKAENTGLSLQKNPHSFHCYWLFILPRLCSGYFNCSILASQRSKPFHVGFFKCIEHFLHFSPCNLLI